MQWKWESKRFEVNVKTAWCEQERPAGGGVEATMYVPVQERDYVSSIYKTVKCYHIDTSWGPVSVGDCISVRIF